MSEAAAADWPWKRRKPTTEALAWACWFFSAIDVNAGAGGGNANALKQRVGADISSRIEAGKGAAIAGAAF